MMKINEKMLKVWMDIFNDASQRQRYQWLVKGCIDAEEEIALKRVIRSYAKKLVDELSGEDRVVRVDEDGSVLVKKVLRATNMEEAEDEFRQEHRIEYYDRGYDCTGQAFTGWHSIFNVNGKYVLYHQISVDC